MSADVSEFKRREEEKRDAALGARERWRSIMAAITWAEGQPQVQRNTPAKCHQLEQFKLGRTSDHYETSARSP
jgi:hypothetical protein